MKTGDTAAIKRLLARQRAVNDELERLVELELEELARQMRDAGKDPLTCSLREFARHLVAQRETVFELGHDPLEHVT